MAVIAARRAPSSQVSHFADLLRSEFCKLRTVRSTYWSLAAAVVFNVALAAILAIVLPSHMSTHQKAAIDSTRVSLGGLHLSQIAFGVLGVLVITSEYGTGMIRATLAAVPQRRLMLAAKTTVGRYLPMVVGEAIVTVHHEAHTLQPWPGFGVFCLYAAAALTVGIVLISRRDA